jgi:hypothetical protein
MKVEPDQTNLGSDEDYDESDESEEENPRPNLFKKEKLSKDVNLKNPFTKPDKVEKKPGKGDEKAKKPKKNPKWSHRRNILHRTKIEQDLGPWPNDAKIEQGGVGIDQNQDSSQRNS